MASGELNAYPPEVLILDFDGVVRHWHDAPVSAIERRHGLSEGTIISTAHGVLEYERGVRGQATFGEWCRATARALASEYGSVAYAAVDEWRSYRGDLDRDVLAAIEAISQTVPVALLSHAHDCLRDDLASFGIARLFVEVVCSAEEGIAKPDPEIYLRTCRRLGVAPGRTVFIDDREVNVIGARSAGLRAEVFVDAQRTLCGGSGRRVVMTLRYEASPSAAQRTSWGRCGYLVAANSKKAAESKMNWPSACSYKMPASSPANVVVTISSSDGKTSGASGALREYHRRTPPPGPSWMRKSESLEAKTGIHAGSYSGNSVVNLPRALRNDRRMLNACWTESMFMPQKYVCRCRVNPDPVVPIEF